MPIRYIPLHPPFCADTLVGMYDTPETTSETEAARMLGRGSLLVFPGVRGKPFASTALSELLGELKIAAAPHGFRSSFRDWAAEETDHPREVADAALAHTVRNPVKAAYNRGTLFERRRAVMGTWGKYVGGLTGTDTFFPLVRFLSRRARRGNAE